MKKNNLVIDIGNTHIVMGVCNGKDFVDSRRISTDLSKTEDEYYVIIKNLLSDIISLDNIFNIALSSVVPSVTRVFDHLIQKYMKRKPIIVTANTDLGLKFSIKNPETIGADLLVNAFAAKEIYKKNAIVCDLGTATTIQLIGENGNFYGTAIIPGIVTSADSLFKKASLLSDIRLEKPDDILGTNTKDALLTGIIRGHAFLLDGFINEIKKDFSYLDDILVIATGGMSPMIYELSSNIDVVDKNLTLHGLNIIANNSKPID